MVAELRARKLTADTLTSWGLAHLRTDAEILVTEMIHGALLGLTLREVSPAEIRVQLQTVGHSLMIEVDDPLSSGCPRCTPTTT